MFRRLGRYRRLGAASFLSCACFIGLAVYGWGVSWSQLLGYMAVVIVLLLLLLAMAALLGWLLHKLNRRDD
ncbi:hypothetical protein [uncultured Gilvimarinus sp.]|uniref:hypothetical protein n=1 Tax=uncultured Gilvimarinus sp. TaxID=1689143 RepID=UPI0030EEA744|tara:strand:- start:1787 stop:1999 length:213 start_codon:yes stop_codon:yes gene_type:complete